MGGREAGIEYVFLDKDAMAACFRENWECWIETVRGIVGGVMS